MSAAPTFYDINLDERRDVIQADVVRWVAVTAAMGLLVRYLRKIGKPDAADKAVEVAQGKITPSDGANWFHDRLGVDL